MDAKDKLFSNIANEIANDQEINEIDWIELSVVVEVAGENVSQTGFSYADDDIEPIVVDSFEFDDYVLELCRLTMDSDNRPFKSVLIQMYNADGRIKFEYEYENGQRWAFGPHNLDTMKEALRPGFCCI